MLLLASMLLPGCATGPFRLQYIWRDDDDDMLSYYVDKTSSIEYPIETDPLPPDPRILNAPRSIRSLDEVSPREISLAECRQLALDAEVFPGNQLLETFGARATTIYDLAITDTNFLFGGRGVEAALSDFDARLQSSVTWGRNEVPQNVATAGLIPDPLIPGDRVSLVQETMAWTTQLQKDLATGGQVSLRHDVNYDGNNRDGGQLYQSSFSGLVQAEIRQPLLAASGVEVTRIIGPPSQNLQNVRGLTEGVLIRRIANDKLLASFEGSVATLIRQVEDAYWDLNLALRLYKSEKEAFEQLTNYWNILQARGESGVPILQAEARVFEADARLRGSLADVLEKESQLRRLCNLPLSDDTFLYPSDAPLEAEFTPSWDAVLQEALAYRPEIRSQKWEIKSQELQLKAAKNVARPRLDFVSQYRRNGLGNHLSGGGDTLANDIGNGQNEGWDVGFQFFLPVGLRLARIRVRHQELELRKHRALLAEMEEETARRISSAMLNMQRWFELADSTTRRIETSKAYVVASEQLVLGNERANSELFNLLLQAQIQQRDAEQAYMRSIIEYNKAMTALNHEKGTLLRDSNIYLAEGAWHPESAKIALQRAKARTVAHDAHKLQTAPMEFAGQPGPSAFESLGTNSRPGIPGALDGSFNSSPSGLPPGSPVPHESPLTPPPVPPEGISPMLVPPPIKMPPVDKDQPTDPDSITRFGNDASSDAAILPPVIIDEAPSGTTGRINL